MATEILFNAVQEYVYPIMEAAGLRVDPYGYIVDLKGKRLCMRNPRYQEGDNVSEVSPVNYLALPIRDSDYLEIKEKNDVELFNPFENIKHMIVIAVKLKKLAVVDLSKELLNTAMDEDDYDKFDDYVGLSNDVNMNGEIDYALVDLYDPMKREIVRHPCPANEPVKGLWALCVDVYNRYICPSGTLKQFMDIEKSWKKIRAAMTKWDKARKTIIKEIKQEEIASMSVDYMDLSDSTTPGEAVNVYTMPHELTYDDFCMTDDGSDINQKNLQDYLTSLFLPESLAPVVEHKESDEEIETIVTPEVEPPVIPTVTPQPAAVIKPVVEPVIESEPPKKVNSMFKIAAKPSNQNNMMGNRMNQFGMNPMMGNPAMYPTGYCGRSQTMDMDQLCLGDVIDPYSMYR